jgi:isoleucyl-tRNA synthetase
MNEILEALVRLMAPILSFTADEIWQYLAEEGRVPSVHADLFIPVKDEYKDPELADRWDTIIGVRKEVTKALEIARKAKMIGHSLDASVLLGLSEELMDLIGPYEKQLKYLFIVSSVEMVPANKVKSGFEGEEMQGVKVKVAPSKDKKCERCWVHDPTTGMDREHPTICKRCLQALSEMEQTEP